MDFEILDEFNGLDLDTSTWEPFGDGDFELAAGGALRIVDGPGSDMTGIVSNSYFGLTSPLLRGPGSARA